MPRGAKRFDPIGPRSLNIRRIYPPATVSEPNVVEYFAEGSPDSVIDQTRTAALVDRLLDGLRQRGPLRRVLLVPPDVTRLHSGAGLLTCLLYERLHASAEV